jgi:hypothetical protein
MHRAFSLFFVCTMLAAGGCANTGNTVQDSSTAGAAEDNTRSRPQTRREARAERRAAKRDAREERAVGRGIQIVRVGNFEGEIHGTPGEGSLFSELRIGMSKSQVFNMIGPGTDLKAYQTGKAFIPFYYGGDRYRTEAFYEGSGRLAFTARGRLVAIIHDASEDGYQ